LGGDVYLIVAEKASVARAIRSALANLGASIQVTNVRGHLMNADLPEGFEWGRVSPLEIMRLRNTRSVVSDNHSYSRLAKLFREGGRLVVATDNDSEGELIGAEILGLYRSIRGGDAPYARMRFNSVERRELLRSWNSLEPELRWTWVSKARFRQSFDLLTGAAFTRLLTQGTRNKVGVRLISWGSCQTPCLNFVVEREKEIESFTPRRFWRLEAVLARASGESFTAGSENIWDETEARRLYGSVENIRIADVREFVEEIKVTPRPLPIRTDDMLRDLTKITKVSARKLLEIMEELYAEGYLSYPRTDTNKYRAGFDFVTPLKLLIKAGIAGENGDKRPMPRNGKLDDGAHPPIYPTGVYGAGGLHKAVWEYAARRFYANAFSDDAKTTSRRALIAVGQSTLHASGHHIAYEGFYKFFPYFRPKDSPLPVLSVGEKLEVISLRLVEDVTKPPARLRESDLLRLMERTGIGTDATRATYPQLIVERGYARRVSGYFQPTPLGRALIDCLEETDPRLVTPETRRMVDELMGMIERGEISEDESLEKAISAYEELLRRCMDRIEAISTRLAAAVLETFKKSGKKLKSHSTYVTQHIKRSGKPSYWNKV
jgi:DNA topoisomerase-1